MIEEIEMQEAKVYWESFLKRKRPLLERKSIAELKELHHRVRDKKWGILEREPFLESHGEAVDIFNLFEIVIKCVIEDKRKGVLNV